VRHAHAGRTQHLSVSFFEEKKPNAKLQTVIGNPNQVYFKNRYTNIKKFKL